MKTEAPHPEMDGLDLQGGDKGEKWRVSRDWPKGLESADRFDGPSRPCHANSAHLGKDVGRCDKDVRAHKRSSRCRADARGTRVRGRRLSRDLHFALVMPVILFKGGDLDMSRSS